MTKKKSQLLELADLGQPIKNKQERVFYEKGWQIKDEVPDNIWAVYEELVKRGYDEYVFYEK